MNKRSKKTQYFLEFLVVRTFVIVMTVMPIGMCYRLGVLVGKLLYYCLPLRKKVAYENIKTAFGDISDDRIKEIIKGMYINFSLFAFEGGMMHRMQRLDMEFVGLENMAKAYNRHEGVILCTAHIGNWQAMGLGLVMQGYPVNNIVKRQRNPLVFEEELKAMHRANLKTTIMQSTPRNILRALKDGDVVEFLGDQNAGRRGVFVPFFGQPASTVTGPALFALKTKSPLLFAVGIRENIRHHKIFIEAIDFTGTHNLENDVLSLTKILNERLEYYVTAYPEQYFWMHKRWKTKQHP